MPYETVDVRKLTGGCGAEVLDIDVKAMSNRQWGEVQAAFAEHGVIFFRDQNLTPEQHIDFARRWAPIDVNRFFKASGTLKRHMRMVEVGSGMLLVAVGVLLMSGRLDYLARSFSKMFPALTRIG